MKKTDAEQQLHDYRIEYYCLKCGFPVDFETTVDDTREPWFAGTCPKCEAEYILQPTGWEVVNY